VTSSRGCHEDATQKTVPRNLSHTARHGTARQHASPDAVPYVAARRRIQRERTFTLQYDRLPQIYDVSFNIKTNEVKNFWFAFKLLSVHFSFGDSRILTDRHVS